MVTKRDRLPATQVGQTGAAPRSADDAVEAGVRVAVTDEDEMHHRSRYGGPALTPVDPGMIPRVA